MPQWHWDRQLGQPDRLSEIGGCARSPRSLIPQFLILVRRSSAALAVKGTYGALMDPCDVLILFLLLLCMLRSTIRRERYVRCANGSLRCANHVSTITVLLLLCMLRSTIRRKRYVRCDKMEWYVYAVLIMFSITDVHAV